ncbi:energy transducer TonB [bacterium J10(2018)]|jgi:hypothetical protein|uniref:TonB C-terminal domain-containing protein n=2 Tax=Muribaculaceae TaxID=2005473 RepID=UPI000EF5CCA5|nr:TonB C-terminal domain-containing protein [uncultured Duncaniella sp.]RLT76719.1 energy transducer TonB [bacterium J10(2018)]ROT10787.1 energy transducer TonB [Muribaculaceae bacterium Isolate-104 (HZI)]
MREVFRHNRKKDNYMIQNGFLKRYDYMKMLVLILLGFMTMASCSHRVHTLVSDSSSNISLHSSKLENINLIRGLDSDSLPYIYVNGEWYPWFGARNLSDFPYDSIRDLTVRNDNYGNRAIFVEYPQSIIDSIKNIKLDYFINTDPSVIFDNGKGNPAKMIDWIKENKRLPKGYTGKTTAVVMYDVNPDGTVANVRLFKESDNGAIDQDAVRLVNSFPRFKVIYYTPWKEPIRQVIRISYNSSDDMK